MYPNSLGHWIGLMALNTINRLRTYKSPPLTLPKTSGGLLFNYLLDVSTWLHRRCFKPNMIKTGLLLDCAHSLRGQCPHLSQRQLHPSLWLGQNSWSHAWFHAAKGTGCPTGEREEEGGHRKIKWEPISSQPGRRKPLQCVFRATFDSDGSALAVHVGEDPASGPLLLWQGLWMREMTREEARF